MVARKNGSTNIYKLVFTVRNIWEVVGSFRLGSREGSREKLGYWCAGRRNPIIRIDTYYELRNTSIRKLRNV